MYWRPHQSIRVKAIGLHWRGAALLAAEVLDDAGRIKGMRPLGGTVEFGESWRAALVREFAEELGVEVTLSGAPLVLENIYEHEGQQGHEILFASDVHFPQGAFEGQDVIHFAEDSGTPCTARWCTLEQMRAKGIALFPAGLEEALGSRGVT